MTEATFRAKSVRLADRLAKVERLGATEVGRFTSDEPTHDLCAFYLILAVEECIDLAEHLVAEKRWGVPESSGGEFDLLAKQGVIDVDLARKMREAVGLRNVLVHQYADTDWRLVHAAANDLGRLRTFLASVLRFAGLESK